MRESNLISFSTSPSSPARLAIELIGTVLQAFAPESVLWLFDKPVSNSGRLAVMVRDIAEAHCWNWQAELIENPDQVIPGSHKIAITSDSVILDGVVHWVNPGAYLISKYFKGIPRFARQQSA